VLRGKDVQEIEELKRQGLSIRAISRLTGYDRKTIRKYLIQPEATPVYGPRPAPPSKLEPFKPYLEERLGAGVWNGQVLLRELRARGYPGGYTILKDWLHPQREAAQTVAVRRFETPPGKQAQVDWGHLGTIEMDGQERKLNGFTFTLGYSRTMMAEAALDQKLGTLLKMHEEAFRQLGGVPEEILYDRMKTVWLEVDERGEVVWHPVFLDFARYWGFRPRLCRPYRAQTDLVTDLGRAYREGRLDRRLRVYLAPKVLIIDEMGYLPLDELGATIFFQLVSARYERGSIILTSNKSYGDWGSIFGDPIIATAILDRLLHHSTTINIRGESYRLKDRRKAGLFPRAEDEARPAPFPSSKSLRNSPRRQGSAAPRKTSAPLTAPGRSANPD